MKWWNAQRLARDAAYLSYRSKVKAEVTRFFNRHEFIEVETPAIQISPGLEPHLAAFQTHLMPAGKGFADLQQGAVRYLHTSPEFAMKKLLAGGLDKIWQITKTYRNGEGSALHHPEFTLLEWYRADADLPKEEAEQSVIQELKLDLQGLIRRIAALAPDQKLKFGDKQCDPFEAWQVCSMAELFETHLNLNLESLIGTDWLNPPLAPIKYAAQEKGLHLSEQDRFEDIFFRLFLEYIEPNLGVSAPTLVVDYPISMAALARAKHNAPQWAERFELYCCGIELANGFGELTDPEEQRRRFIEDQALKQQLYDCQYPIDEDFLNALANVPPAAGIALGIDRLIMLVSGADHIDQTLWAHVD